VVRYLALQTGDRELAQDLAQETFARLYEFRASHPTRTLSVSWLYTVARRLAIDHWRAVGARPRTAPLDENARHLAHDAPDQAVVLRQEVAEVLERMPKAERECLVLFYFEDWPLELIARELNLSAVTVRVRLHRARGRFRGLWHDVEREEGAGHEPVS
jgi:RNA polymerase sigma-70 factor (ECF subfamily)